ncbi:MAG: hypothetical protein HC846_10010 [Blastocatellia bacterium]|nr:hypothetical protein [Blastocatellia bacterium]
MDYQKAQDIWTKKFAGYLALLLIIQVIFGGLTLVMLAPIVMQVGHLLLADLIWITFILMWASFLSNQQNLE